MKKIIFSLMAACTVSFSSCSDSFLELSNPSALSPEYFPKTIEDMELIVNALYAQPNSMHMYGFYMMGKHSFICDHTVDMAWSADQVWNQQALHEVSADNENILLLWDGLYKTVNAANTVIEEADRFKGESTPEVTARLSQIRGEGLFWRAWAHQHLVQYWGEGFPCNGDGDKLGVPLRTRTATSIDQVNLMRSTVNEVYEQIRKDYVEAESLLPESWSERPNKPRPTKWTCRSFKGQTELYAGNYGDAAKDLKEVIDKSGKRLADYAEYEKMFNDDQPQFNDESILELNFKEGSSSTGWGNWNGAEGSMHIALIALCYTNPEGKPAASSWSNLCFNDANIDRFGSDPRLKIAALEPGTPVVMNGVETVVSKYILDRKNDDYRGWSVRKYNYLKKSAAETQMTCGVNMYLMRLADVYQMYAEACIKNGDDASAREYLNKVRRRAYNLPVDTPAEIDIKSSGTQLFDDLVEERFKEFCGEGVQHWVDLCRWKRLDKELKDWYPQTLSGTPRYEARDLYYPIPQKELDANASIVQSPAWK